MKHSWTGTRVFTATEATLATGEPAIRLDLIRAAKGQQTHAAASSSQRLTHHTRPVKEDLAFDHMRATTSQRAKNILCGTERKCPGAGSRDASYGCCIVSALFSSWTPVPAAPYP